MHNSTNIYTYVVICTCVRGSDSLDVESVLERSVEKINFYLKKKRKKKERNEEHFSRTFLNGSNKNQILHRQRIQRASSIQVLWNPDLASRFRRRFITRHLKFARRKGKACLNGPPMLTILGNKSSPQVRSSDRNQLIDQPQANVRRQPDRETPRSRSITENPPP